MVRSAVEWWTVWSSPTRPSSPMTATRTASRSSEAVMNPTRPPCRLNAICSEAYGASWGLRSIGSPPSDGITTQWPISLPLVSASHDDPPPVRREPADDAAALIEGQLRQRPRRGVPAIQLRDAAGVRGDEADVGRVDRDRAEQDGGRTEPLLPSGPVAERRIGCGHRHGRTSTSVSTHHARRRSPASRAGGRLSASADAERRSGDVGDRMWAGIVGPVLFVAAFLVEGAIRAGYDPMRLQVSYLSLGDRGWIQVASFLDHRCAAGRVRRSGCGGDSAHGWPGARGVPIAVGAISLGLLIAGLFSTRRPSAIRRARPTGGRRACRRPPTSTSGARSCSSGA